MLYLRGNFKPAVVHSRGSQASKQLSNQTIVATLSKPFRNSFMSDWDTK